MRSLYAQPPVRLTHDFETVLGHRKVSGIAAVAASSPSTQAHAVKPSAQTHTSVPLARWMSASRSQMEVGQGRGDDDAQSPVD